MVRMSDKRDGHPSPDWFIAVVPEVMGCCDGAINLNPRKPHYQSKGKQNQPLEPVESFQCFCDPVFHCQVSGSNLTLFELSICEPVFRCLDAQERSVSYHRVNVFVEYRPAKSANRFRRGFSRSEQDS